MVFDCKTKAQFIQRSDISTIYFNEIRKYPLLTVKEERNLLYAVKFGNRAESEEARERIIKCNQRFVISAAKKWQNGSNFMDIVNEGNIGLMTAIEKFDINKKQRFLTYAVFWIRKAINEYIINKEGMIRPKNANKIYTYANKARNSFFMRNERYPSLEELSEELVNKYNVRVYDKTDLLQFVMVTTDSTSNNDGDNEQGYSDVTDFEISTASNNTEDYIESEYTKSTAKLLLNCLTEKEKQVIKFSFGFESCCEENFETIGYKMDIPTDDVKQLYTEALKKMTLASKELNI